MVGGHPLSWGSPWCGTGCYELAGLVKSSTPVMVALQKKQSLLFIRCWLMQALGQRRKDRELLPAQYGGPGAGSYPGRVQGYTCELLTCTTCGSRVGRWLRWGVHSR